MFDKDARILIVDDHEACQERVQLALSKYGFNNVVKVSDGKEALEAIGQTNAGERPYDLVITDLNMPNMGGFELLKTIKFQEETRNIPVIVVSLEGEKESIIDAIHYGVDEYIIKPFDELSLFIKMQSVYFKLHPEKISRD